MFNKYNYSIFANLKDLSQYSLHELKQRVGKSYIFNSYVEENLLISTFTDKYTIHVIHYTLNGEFIKIYSETWKSPSLYFKRKNGIV
jgi:hypothetical protein